MCDLSLKEWRKSGGREEEREGEKGESSQSKKRKNQTKEREKLYMRSYQYQMCREEWLILPGSMK